MNKQSSPKPLVWGALIVGLAAIAYVLVAAYQRPLAPTLNLPTLTARPVQLAQAAVQPVSAGADQATATPAAATAAAGPSTGGGKGCNQKGSLTILFLGSDSSIGNPPYGADTIRLVRVNFDQANVTVISFSRDLVVPAAALNDSRYTSLPFGEIFKMATLAAQKTGANVTDQNTAAARVMAQTMQDVFGVHSDNYTTIQLSNLAVMIDTLGGVPIDVPTTITTERNVTFYAGPQTFDGAQAVEYIRAIKPGGDSARTIRQNVFLEALQAKMLSTKIVPKVPVLLTQFKKVIVTDLSPEQIVGLTCLGPDVTAGNVTYISTTSAPGYPSIDAIKAFLAPILSQ